ncbi:50S ribosomal protein L13 [candidate division WOR-3 bacterium JGI_Cruoil_03_44_89]|uniref:Large ribosomal subunit protein uL13 n=1 Tax=candidate division WOR-3 bacterium JGI_Cruoil_03_44_89 TaxID=1973748 RepID=A0A235BZH2_UNCW3|nr:MAG: 50S ribosomal protein L13 [candidate division WOR-3 bacterium JGI_Cruoil_03_44_89]
MEKKWYIIDADGKILGRLATRIATILRGKHKPEFTPNADMGDYVICINASKVKVTGKKETEKVYTRYTGYPGGLKKTTLKEMRKKKPEEIIHHAVKGMLPKGPLGRKMIKKLKVYPGSEHPHKAQNPIELEQTNRGTEKYLVLF